MALNAPVDPRPAGLPPGRRLLDSLWLAASSPQATIALAVLLALSFALAALIPQLPAGLRADAAGRWLSTTSAALGRFGTFFASSGLLDVLGGAWILGLLALLAFHLALRVAGQLRYLLRPALVAPSAPQGLPYELVHVSDDLAALEPKVAAEAARQRRHFLTATLAPDGAQDAARDARPRLDAFFERNSWAAIGPLLTYLGPLLIIGGLLWNSVAGWRVVDLNLTPGRVSQPAEANGLALTLVTADDADSGQPGVISLAQGNQTVNVWLGGGRPARWGSVWAAQRSSGPALIVTAQADGRRQSLQPLAEGEAAGETLRLRFDQNESEQGFVIPTANLAFRVVSYASLPEQGIERPVFSVEGFAGADTTPQLNELIEDERDIAWQGVTLSFRRDRYVVVDLAAMPGLPLLLVGGLALLAGAAIAAWGGLTRVWVNAAAEGDGPAAGALLAARCAAPAAGQRAVADIVATLATDSPAIRAASRVHTLFGGRAWALASLACALAAAAWLVWPLLAAQNAPSAARSLLMAHLALAGLGLGAWLPALWASLRWATADTAPAGDPALPEQMLIMQGRAGDPGRGIALAAFPLLVAAALTGAAWGLLTFASPLNALAPEMWLLAALCLAAAYFHGTSGWRPLRVGSWLPALLALATVAAAAAVLLTAPSFLTG